MAIDPETLKNISLFQGLSEKEIVFIAENARQRVYRAETTIASQEELGETFYVVLNGTLRISAPQPDGTQVFLALLGKGDTVGEMSLIDKRGRSADVVTRENSTLLTIGRLVFDELMTNGSTFPMNMMRMLVRRLRLSNVRLQAHCALQIPGKIAFQLVEFAENYGEVQPNGSVIIPIRLTQQDIADLVGASRERVNQVMVRLRASNLIQVDNGSKITVLDVAGLRRTIM